MNYLIFPVVFVDYVFKLCDDKTNHLGMANIDIVMIIGIIIIIIYHESDI